MGERTQSDLQHNIKPKFKGCNLQSMFIISMNNKYYSLFKFFLTLICVFSSFLYAFYAAFRYDTEFWSRDEYRQFIERVRQQKLEQMKIDNPDKFKI